MKNIIKIFVLLCAIGGDKKAYSQQYVQFTHYMYNVLAVNPAYAGSHDALNITALYRNQWVGLEGAPKSVNLYAHTPIFKGLGLGLSYIHDQIGPLKLSNLAADLSYAVRLSKKGRLAFGLKSGANMYRLNAFNLNTISGTDLSLASQVVNKTQFNMGAGAYYYTDQFYLGLSSPNVIENNLQVGGSDVSTHKHYYLVSGAIFPVALAVDFKPSVAFKYVPNAPLSIDLSAQFLLQKKLWLGVMHRWGDSFGALIGYQFSPQLKAGYSYDITSSKLRSTNSGSHELFISYDFNFKQDKIISPRYF